MPNGCWTRSKKTVLCTKSRPALNIQEKFGESFVYENENGNLAISRQVLADFRHLTEGKVVWEREEKRWRLLDAGESYEGRAVD